MIKTTRVNQTNVANDKAPFAYSAVAQNIKALLVAGFSLTAFASPLVVAQADQQIAVSTQESHKKSANVEQEDETEIIEITGIRYSQRSAIDRKKSATTMMDSIVAEDIGAFPDKNIAEALQRIPGIQLEREFGEGKGINIRGVPSDLIRVEVNNISQLGADESRAVDFTGMASEIVKSLDVIKGTEARLTEGGVGGTVQVNTRKPNEFESNFISVSGESQYNNLTDADSPKFNLVGVVKFSDDFGILVNGTYADKTTAMHTLTNTEWQRVADFDHLVDKSVVDEEYAHVTDIAICDNPDIDDRNACRIQWYDFSPKNIRNRLRDKYDQRFTINSILQYRFSDTLSTHLGFTNSKRDQLAQDFNFTTETMGAAVIVADSVIVDEFHNVREFETVNASMLNEGYHYTWLQQTSMIDVGFEYDNDKIKVVGIASRSTAEEDIDQLRANVRATGLSGTQFVLDSAGLPQWNFADGTFASGLPMNVNDPASYNERVTARYSPKHTEGTQDMAQVDFTYFFDSGFFSKIQTGVRLTSNERQVQNWRSDITRNVGQQYNGETFTHENLTELITGNTGMSPDLYLGYDLGVKTIPNYMTIHGGDLASDLFALAGNSQERADNDIVQGSYEITESTLGGYVQADFTTEFETPLGYMEFWGNVGVRIVETETETFGDVVVEVRVDDVEVTGIDENGNNITEVPTDDLTGFDKAPVVYELTKEWDGTIHPDSFSGRKSVFEDYTDILPSINLNLALIPDELVLFVGTGKVMSRPRMDDLNSNANCTQFENRASKSNGYSANGTEDYVSKCSAGNPNLEPYRAKQLDISLSWYPDEDSLISGSYFTKNITSWVLNKTIRDDIDFFSDGRSWRVTQKINGSGATTKGIELQASTIFTSLPAPFNHLGGSVNYTYMDSENVGLYDPLTGKELPFPSQSKNSYNIVGFYEDDNYSLRLAYNYRDSFYTEGYRNIAAFVEDAGYLDAKFTYTVTDTNFKLYIDGRNLTNQARIVTGGQGRMLETQWSGREVSLGFAYKM